VHDKNNGTREGTAPDAALYTPPSFGHVERVVQRLLARYRKKSLPECQHAAARMYGYPTWESLQAAVAGGGSASRYDDEEAPEVVRARREWQCEAALLCLAGVSDRGAEAPEYTGERAAGPAGYSISRRYDPEHNRRRLERARRLHAVAYARDVIEEVRPSARLGLEIPDDDDQVRLVWRVDVLPRALKSWIAQQRPALVHWGANCGSLRVRQRCPAELLEFSLVWGELCVRQAGNIPNPLRVYPIALCAHWYARVACLNAPEHAADFQVLEAGDAGESQRRRAAAALEDAIRRQEARFLGLQPTEDLRLLCVSAREQQMQAGHALLRRYMQEAATQHTIRTMLARPSWLALAPALAAR
jgi:hypothetical protein